MLSYEKIEDIAKNYSVIPLVEKLPIFFDTSLSVYIKTKSDFLFESVENNHSLGRYSIVAKGARRKFVINDNLIEDYELKEGSLALKDSVEQSNPLEYIREELRKITAYEYSDLPPFYGGLMGYLGYEGVSFFEDISDIPNDNDLSLPTGVFIIPEELYIVDHVKNEINFISFIYTKNESLKDGFSRVKNSLEKFKNSLNSAMEIPKKSFGNIEKLDFKSNIKKDEFIENIKKIKEKIIDGDAIQVVYSRKIKCNIPDNAELFLYMELRKLNPSPYMYFMKFEDFQIIGSSPEMMAKLDSGNLTLKPIAGTIKRGATSEEDKLQEESLLNDPKEQSEHLMLVDLGRNDLHKISKTDTLKVEKYMQIEAYSHVFHLVSTITSTIKEGLDAFDLLKATFPAGTLSGAPKVEAMKIIHELENEKRDIYGGSVFVMNFGATYLDSCIVIRTMILKDGKVHLQAGAGIVYDSIPEKEYQETEIKMQALRNVIEKVVGEKDDSSCR